MKQGTQSVRESRAHLDPLDVSCPGCLAAPGKPCCDWQRAQVATHPERAAVAQGKKARR